MKEIGMLNRQIDSALNRQGHMDGLMVVDAGFPCPDDVELIDIALAPGKPSVLEVLAEIALVHSVEKVVLAQLPQFRLGKNIFIVFDHCQIEVPPVAGGGRTLASPVSRQNGV